MSKNYMTSEGIAKLEEKLEYLKTVRRQEVADRIKSAISLGDLSENSEYEDAKNEQAFVEGEISTLENTLRSVEVIEDTQPAAGDVVVLGTKVTLLDESNNTQREYTIVGSNEADPFKGRISNESPVGAACMGHREGDVVELTTPGGTRKLQIVAVERQ